MVTWDSTVVFDNFQIRGGRAGNAFEIWDTPASTTLHLNTGTGRDQVSVRATSGPVTIEGDDGFFDSVGVGFDGVGRLGGLLTITNSKGLTDVRVNDDFFARTAILYKNPDTGFHILSGLLGGDIVMRGRDLVELTVFTGFGDDQFRIHDTPRTNKFGETGLTVILTGEGNDQVLVTGTVGSLAIEGGFGADTVSFGRNGSVQDIRGAVVVRNERGSTAVNVDNSADDFNSRTMILYEAGDLNVISGLSPADIFLRGNDLSSLGIRMGDAGNFVRIHDTPTSRRHIGLATTIYTGNGSDTVNVNGTSGALALEVGGGLNAITVGSKDTALDRIQGVVTITGAGGTNNVTIDDRATYPGRALTHTVAPYFYTRTGAAPLYLGVLRNFDIFAGTARDTFDVSALVDGTFTHTVSIDGGGDVNTLDYSGYAGRPPAAPPAPVSRYRADGDFTDAAGANHGTPSGGVTFAGGRTGQAFRFDGVDDYIDLGNAPSLNTPGSVTFEAWINYQPLGSAAYKYFFADFAADGNTTQGSLGIIGSRLFWHQTMTGGSFIQPQGATDLVAGRWYHVAVVRDDAAKTVKLYVNGVQDASQSYTGSVVGLQSTKVLGTSLPVGFPSDFFGGLIDEASIYNRALSAAEIQARFGGAGGSSSSGVVVNLVQGTATGLAGGINRIENVIGSAGNDILVGNALANVLVGNAGRDLLIGGQGRDTLTGNGDDDLLIAGTTAFDANPAALTAIQAEWSSARDYNTRVANLRGTGSGPRLNDNYVLQASGPTATVFDDGAVDVLTGSAGTDWFFANLDGGVLDQITDLGLAEIVDELV